MIELSETQIFDLIQCNQCSTISNDTKVMPCGVLICQRCIESNQETTNCSNCSKIHPKESCVTSNSVKLLTQIYEKRKMKQSDVYDNIILETDLKLKSNEQIKKQIEKDYNLVAEKINLTVLKLINEIKVLEKKLLNEIKLAKEENFINFDHQSSTNDNEAEKTLITFEPNISKHNITLIGEINYGAYKYNILSKLENLNNKTFHIEANLSQMLNYNDLSFKKTKYGILDRNKIFLIYERYAGNVNLLNLRVIYLDGTVISTYQINGTWIFHSYFIYDKYILIAFKTKYCLYHINLLNDKLQVLRTFSFHLDLNQIQMNSKEIYFIVKNAKNVIYIYDYDFNMLDSIGQNRYSKRSFYINGHILAIENDKIYVKKGLNLTVLSKLNGIKLESFTLESDFDHLFLDINHDRYLIYKKYNELLMFDNKWKLKHKTTLETMDGYDEFQFSKSGHFCFMNSRTNKILIV